MKKWYQGIKIFESKDCFVLKEEIKKWNRIRNPDIKSFPEIVFVKNFLGGCIDDNTGTDKRTI